MGKKDKEGKSEEAESKRSQQDSGSPVKHSKHSSNTTTTTTTTSTKTGTGTPNRRATTSYSRSDSEGSSTPERKGKGSKSTKHSYHHRRVNHRERDRSRSRSKSSRSRSRSHSRPNDRERVRDRGGDRADRDRERERERERRSGRGAGRGGSGRPDISDLKKRKLADDKSKDSLPDKERKGKSSGGRYEDYGPPGNFMFQGAPPQRGMRMHNWMRPPYYGPFPGPMYHGGPRGGPLPNQHPYYYPPPYNDYQHPHPPILRPPLPNVAKALEEKNDTIRVVENKLTVGEKIRYVEEQIISFANTAQQPNEIYYGVQLHSKYIDHKLYDLINKILKTTKTKSSRRLSVSSLHKAEEVEEEEEEATEEATDQQLAIDEKVRNLLMHTD